MTRRCAVWGLTTFGGVATLMLIVAPPAGALFGCGLDPICIAGKGVGAAAGGVAGDVITAVAKAVAQAVGEAVKAVATFWVRVPTPGLTTTNGAPSDPVNYLQTHLYYFSGALAVAALLVAGAKLAIEQRGEGVRQIAALLLRLAVVTGMGVLAIDLAVAAADQASTWIIDQSTNNTDFGANITALLGLTTLTGGAVGAMLVIVLGLIAILASVIQILLMVVRGGMLVMLAGILPTAAAASNFEFGQQWFKKTTAWTVAFILYKPAAAIVYATAFRLAGDNVFSGNGLVSVITGLSLMILALLALPALMRFVVPAVGTLASGSAGGVLAGAALAAATMPTGALRIGGGGARSAGGSSGSNGSGPSSNGGGGGSSPSGSGTPGGGGMAMAATGGGAASNGAGGGGGVPSSAGAVDAPANGTSGSSSGGTAGGGTAGGGGGTSGGGGEQATGAGSGTSPQGNAQAAGGGPSGRSASAGGTASGATGTPAPDAGAAASGGATGAGSAGGAGGGGVSGAGAGGAGAAGGGAAAAAGGAAALYNAINKGAQAGAEHIDDNDEAGGPSGSQR